VANLLTLVAATAILVMISGPNVALITGGFLVAAGVGLALSRRSI
jgi:hypothetical protein